MFATKTRQILMWIVNALNVLGLGSLIIYLCELGFWDLLFFAWIFIIFGLLTAGALTLSIIMSVSLSKMISGKKACSNKVLILQTISSTVGLLLSIICFSFLLIRTQHYDLWLVLVAIYSNVILIHLVFSIISNTQLMRKVKAERAALEEAQRMSEATPLQALLSMADGQYLQVPGQYCTTAQYAPVQQYVPAQQYVPVQQPIPNVPAQPAQVASVNQNI